MFRLVLSTILSFGLVGPALALSCVRPDIAASFNRASDSEKEYVVLLGQFDFAPPQKIEGKTITVESQFRGKLLTRAGFSEGVEVPTEIEMTCLGPWCSEVRPGTDYIAFVEQSETALNFIVGPCYGFAFEEPNDDTIARLEQCAAGGTCEPEDPF